MTTAERVIRFQQTVDEMARERSSLDGYFHGELRELLRRWIADIAAGQDGAACQRSIELVTSLCAALEREREQSARLCELLVSELRHSSGAQAA